LKFLPRLPKAHLYVLRAASASLGWDFSEDDWAAFARAHDLPVASTFARVAGGGSFAFAKFLARVGPLPPHPDGSRFQAPHRLTAWETETLLLGAMTVARMNGGWPPYERFDEAARKARGRGVEVPLIGLLTEKLGLRYNELKAVAETLANSIAKEPARRHGFLTTYNHADQVARGLALGIELLGGERPSSDLWDRDTESIRERGVPATQLIYKTFGTWQAAWLHVDALGLDAGVQSDQRPRYKSTLAIARGMARAEDELGYRPTPTDWTDAVRDLKRRFGPGIIPAKPTIYYYFESWRAAWMCVDALRARELL
jgi:hypothetical protein